ncbi:MULTISPECIES: hypothetical protein [unclassified Aureimonas]|uniref:hypothetical protein n=1 Tax=unclassified Aureimonas TaxID=2615206 RepID=UPI00138F982D|nr:MULTISPECIES: hypothetical protein [unclassified Aureimonas]
MKTASPVAICRSIRTFWDGRSVRRNSAKGSAMTGLHTARKEPFDEIDIKAVEKAPTSALIRSQLSGQSSGMIAAS